MKPLLIIPALFAAALIYISADRGAGLSTWMRDRDALANSEEQIARLEAEIVRLKAAIGRLERDPFAIERAIREDLEWARAGETVVRLPGALDSNPRFP
ncbi:MAG: septum formation initiator family protein [Myxococcales bacterium]|nr:septum formation initiator family protein [Myxococcales bacterium]